MMTTKTTSSTDETIYYQPRHLIEGDAAEYETPPNYKAPGQYNYHRLDALYHFFDPNPAMDGETPPSDEDGRSKMYHAEAIVKLMDDYFIEDSARAVDACQLHTEVGFTQFRDQASFIGGDLTRGHIPQIRHWCYTHFNDTIYLDATGYSGEIFVNEERSAFEQLMELAGRTKEVIDEGICKRWPTDTKAVMRFINAHQTDSIISTNRIYDEGEQIETKWMVEGSFLAEELIKIPGFQQNFNKLVIFGAMRYILSGDLNLNKLYRLMAKLGRTNTRLFFVG